MNSKELRNLQEAYLEVYNEEEKWIQKAIKRPGAFTAKAKEHDMSPQEFAAYVDKHPEKFDTTTKKQANLAQTLKGIKKEDVDVYDVILSHLIDEGYAETPEAAEAIMVNMSEEWRESIIENQLNEISQKTATRAFATRATGEFEYDTNPSDYTKSGKSKSDETKRRIERKFGKKAGAHAERAAHASIFGRKGAGGMPSVD